MWTAEHRRLAARQGLRYPSDLTDGEWALIEPMIPPAKRGGRRREVNVREVLNAIFYVLSTGCQWQALPKDLPPKSTAHHYFVLWDWDGTLDRIHHALYVETRERAGREASPSAAIIDSQSGKAAQKGALRSTRKALMRARRSPAASAISWSIRWACQRAPKFPQKWALKIPLFGGGGLRSVISRRIDRWTPLMVAGHVASEPAAG